jgi:hypothetical protein
MLATPLPTHTKIPSNPVLLEKAIVVVVGGWWWWAPAVREVKMDVIIHGTLHQPRPRAGGERDNRSKTREDGSPMLMRLSGGFPPETGGFVGPGKAHTSHLPFRTGMQCRLGSVG